MEKKGRPEAIVRYLINQEKAVTISKIAEVMEVSERTVQNRLNECQNLLIGNVEIEKVGNKGIRITGDKDYLDEIKHRFGNQNINENDDKERRMLILIDILLSNKPLSMQDISFKYFVSVSIVQRDIDWITFYIDKNTRTIEVIRKPKVGVYVEGNEAEIRQLIEKNILCLTNYYKVDHHENVVFDESIAYVLKIIGLDCHLQSAIVVEEMIRNKLNRFLTDEARKEFILQILISDRRSFEHCKFRNNIQCDQNKEKEIFDKILADSRFNLDDMDKKYLWLRLIRGRYIKRKSHEYDDKYLEMAKELLESIMDICPNDEIDYLIDNLAYHISQADKRSVVNMSPNNPILSDIKKQYGNFYSMTLTTLYQMEKKYNIKLNEDEVGFITVYICAIYEKNIRSKKCSVLLICDEDPGQIELLKIKLFSNFPNFEIDKIITSFDLWSVQLEDYGLILSTSTIKLNEKYKGKMVRISSMLSKDDCQNISQNLINYCELKSRFNDDLDFIYFDSICSNKDEVLNEYLDKAEKMGYVTNLYKKSVFKREELAPTDIGRLIAIPHGNDEYIKKPCIFMVRNKKSILWGDDYAKSILFLMVKFKTSKENRRFFQKLYSAVGKTNMIQDINSQEDLERFKQYLFKEN